MRGVHFAPSYRGFLALCRAVEYPLKPFQRTIARAFFGPEREVGVCVNRGAAKSTLASLIALHHVLSVPDASVYVGAASLEQANTIGGIVQRYAKHPAIARLLTTRHHEVRLGDRRGPTVLQIVSSDGERAHGWERPTLMIADEVWAHRDREPTLLGAMVTSLVKNATAKLLLISVAHEEGSLMSASKRSPVRQGIESRRDARNREQHRGYVTDKRTGGKLRGPWTTSLAEARS